MLELASAVFLLVFFKSTLQASFNLNMWDLSVLPFSVFIKIWDYWDYCRLLKLFSERCRKYSSCLISFLSFCELFLACNCATVIGNLINIWSGFIFFSPYPSWLLSRPGKS